MGTRLDVRDGASVLILSVEPRGLANADVMSEHIMRSDRSNRLYAYSWPLDEQYGLPWKNATEAVGTVLAGGSSTDLVTEVQPKIPGELAHVQSFRIVYEDEEGTRYQVDSKWQLIISTEECRDADALLN